MAAIYGIPPGPYVRKVMLAHGYKKIKFDIITTMPGSDDPEFRKASPMGKIPAYLTDSGQGFSDSSIIIAYLERTCSTNPLYPVNNEDYAHALWLEEYADTKMSEATNALYYQRVIGPKFRDHITDEVRVEEILSSLLPPVLSYLESQLPDNKWFYGDRLSVADLCIGSNLISLMHANYSIDVGKWPKLAAFFQQFIAQDFVQQQIAIEQKVFAG